MDDKDDGGKWKGVQTCPEQTPKQGATNPSLAPMVVISDARYGCPYKNIGNEEHGRQNEFNY